MFHSFSIGKMHAMAVSDGPLTLPPAAKIFQGPDEAAINAALTQAQLPTDHVRVEQNCLLLETAGKRALFDNGPGSEKLYGPDSGQLLGSFRSAGIDPDSIDAVVLTHARACPTRATHRRHESLGLGDLPDNPAQSGPSPP